MEKVRNTLLVTWDYTEVSESALQHALRIAKMVENNIRIVHVMDPSVARKKYEETDPEVKKEIEFMEKWIDKCMKIDPNIKQEVQDVENWVLTG